MNHRLGICSSCKAQYKVPASFQADRAKCKSCGGVVDIGPVVGAAATAAAAPAPAPAPQPAPAAAAPARPAPARPAIPSAPKPAPKPVAEEKDSVRAAAAAAAERVRDAGRKSAIVEEVPAVRSRQGSSGRTKDKADARKRGAAKPPSKAPMLAGVGVLVVLAGAGAWFAMRGDDSASQAAEKDGGAAPEHVADAPAAAEAASEPAPSEPEAAQAPSATGDDAAAAPDATAEATPAAQAAVAAQETPPAKPAEADTGDVDLSTIPDLAKLPGTSDADWASIQEWTATFLDAKSGAAGNRALAKLIERGRESFPAVLNAMKRLDFSTDDGFRAGDVSQRLFLMQVCGGRNYDWKYGREPADVLFNKKVVQHWIGAWEKAQTPKAWADLTKMTEADAVELFEKTGPFATGDSGAATTDLDDL